MREKEAARKLRAYIHGLGDRTREGQELILAALKEERQRCADRVYAAIMKREGIIMAVGVRQRIAEDISAEVRRGK